MSLESLRSIYIRVVCLYLLITWGLLCELQEGGCRFRVSGGSKLLPLPEGELPGAVCTNPVLFLLTDTAIGNDGVADIALSQVPIPIGSLLPQKKYFAQKLTGYHTKVCVYSGLHWVFYMNQAVYTRIARRSYNIYMHAGADPCCRGWAPPGTTGPWSPPGPADPDRPREKRARRRRSGCGSSRGSSCSCSFITRRWAIECGLCFVYTRRDLLACLVYMMKSIQNCALCVLT